MGGCGRFHTQERCLRRHCVLYKLFNSIKKGSAECAQDRAEHVLCALSYSRIAARPHVSMQLCMQSQLRGMQTCLQAPTQVCLPNASTSKRCHTPLGGRMSGVSTERRFRALKACQSTCRRTRALKACQSRVSSERVPRDSV